MKAFRQGFVRHCRYIGNYTLVSIFGLLDEFSASDVQGIYEKTGIMGVRRQYMHHINFGCLQ
jgi:hypothetical protein